MNIVNSIIVWVSFGFTMLIWRIVMPIVKLFDKDPMRPKTGYTFRMLGKSLVKMNLLWKLRIFGKMPPNSRKPYIVVCNHQSLIDVPIICCLSWDMKWIAKQELFEKPLIGWMLKAAADIPVERDSKRGKVKTLIQVAKTLEGKSTVMVFPEGTRSPDGRLYPFMEGVFSIAIDRKIDILTLVLDGSANCLPKKSLIFQKVRDIKLRVFEPIEIDKLPAEERTSKAISQKIRLMMLNQLAEWRQVDPQAIDAANELSVLEKSKVTT